MAAFATALVPLGIIAAGATPAAAAGTVGNGFVVTTGDLAFILKQIKISEHHAATFTPSDPCGTLVGPGPDQIPDRLSAYGLRTVDGSCNNLFPEREHFAAADQPFPRLTTPNFRAAEDSPPAFGPPHPTSYTQKKGSVFDSQPRVVSNLIVDQTSTNPAAVAAAEFPVRTQGNPGLFPCTTDPDPLADPPVAGVPANCVPSHQTLFIPNVTTDVGLSPPYNSLFTFFGQFFDHGVDQTVKSGGTVFVPLRADDPLITLGPDGKAGTGDEVTDPNLQFMVLTRAQNQPGPDGVLGDNPATAADESADDVQNANNTDSPWVDQSQTYTSHASHQAFLREYAMTAGRPTATGRLLGGLPAGATYPGSPDGTNGISTWAAVKKQSAEKLGLLLADTDVLNVPMLATDPYGKFLPGPSGLPQYVTTTGLVEGNLAGPVPVPGNVLHFDTPFLTDIAHNADPSPQDADHNPATPPTTPTPDSDTVPSADFAAQAPGTYDDEMLNAHFACGDGRCNENIALSTIHQVFHSEHDRLAGAIDATLQADAAASAAGAAVLADWQSTTRAGGYNYGERLFQAARFVTEMEYQHLVFEEFGRKVQPAIRPFHVYNPDVDAAVQAEFAHAVYRFGHSMLDDTVARVNENADGSRQDNSLPLLTAFLNPPEYFHNNAGPAYTPEQAAGAIVMGSSEQVGNELDEFVTETLRNNLLGLPLDLATLNMARARDAGVPRLNDLRRQINARTNDGALAPYTDWSDFGQHLKHPESLINFVAAYGLHPSITSKTTAADKRAAAKLIVDPADPGDPAIPADAAEFMFGTGAWANQPDGVTVTGVDDVDLWVGGLAEVTNLGGGLLGSTFNYVFQSQMESLQDFDRLYYLNRTPGMNLRTQLEGNSFSEMIQRNTEGTHSLKADAFATSDCKFEVAHLISPVPAGAPAGNPADASAPGNLIFGAGSVLDDPTSDCNENALLLRKPDGTVQYRLINKVDPSGINGQSVYNGTTGDNRIFGGIDNDTFWGGPGRDVIEGNNGDDVALGGDGNDIITDLNGADVPKGGPGNDAVDGGPGDDIVMGNEGQDFLNGGQNDNETFAGPGNDFIIAGAGADAVFGDGGDDWIEGGSGQDLLQGDHGAPFFDDPAETQPGNDIFIGQVGENDYDSEGGDDIMSQNAAVDRNAGAGGWDWAMHQYDTVGADDDMEINNNLVGVPIQVVVNRDRWQETEADSGSRFNDVIKGTDTAPGTLGGAGFTGCDALDTAGRDRIAGLDALVPNTLLTGDARTLDANAAAGVCPLTGPFFGAGNLLLGGAGSDTITGRGADDIIDGDKALNVRISVRTDPADAATEIGSTDLMENKAVTGNFGAGTTNMTLQQAVFAGLVDPGNLVAVREILSPPATDSASIDTAVFLAPRASYTITVAGGKVTVDQTGALVAPQKVSDGIDTLTGIERLQFTDQTLTVSAPAAPTAVTAVAGNASATVSWTAPPPTANPITGFAVQPIDATGTALGLPRPAGTATSLVVGGLTNGVAVRFTVTATNAVGTSVASAPSNSVTPTAPPTLAAAPAIGTATPGNASATVTWTAPANTGNVPLTGFTVRVVNAANAQVGALRPAPGAGTTSLTVTGLTNGQSYRLQVAAVNSVGTGPFSALSNAVTPANVPGAPFTATAIQGAAGGALTATVLWLPPLATGGSAVVSYRVTALRMSGAGAGATVVSSTVLPSVPAGTLTTTFASTAPAGTNFRFDVQAVNAVGAGAATRTGNVVPR